jgi:predicted nuclease of predicted toxin-antitoxin system
VEKTIDQRLFIVDENLPPDLASILRGHGLNALHINETRQDQDILIPDQAIARYTIHHPCVVVSADDDFVRSHISRLVPDKLIYVFGLTGKSTLIKAIDQHIKKALSALSACDLVEIGPEGIRTPLD